MTAGQRITIMLWLTAMFFASWYVPCDETRAGNYVGLQGVTIFHPGNARPGVRVNGIIWLFEIMIISGAAFWCFYRLSPPVTMMCTRCGYDLRGSIPAGATTCPECGQPITDEQIALQQIEPDHHPHNPTTAARDAVVIALCAGAALSLMLLAVQKIPALTGGPKSHIPKDMLVLNACTKAMKGYAWQEGNRIRLPKHVSHLVPKYLDGALLGLDKPLLPPWPNDNVYPYGQYYFIRHTTLEVKEPTATIVAFSQLKREGFRFAVYADGHCEAVMDEDLDELLTFAINAISENYTAPQPKETPKP